MDESKSQERRDATEGDRDHVMAYLGSRAWEERLEAARAAREKVLGSRDATELDVAEASDDAVAENVAHVPADAAPVEAAPLASVRPPEAAGQTVVAPDPMPSRKSRPVWKAAFSFAAGSAVGVAAILAWQSPAVREKAGLPPMAEQEQAPAVVAEVQAPPAPTAGLETTAAAKLEPPASDEARTSPAAHASAEAARPSTIEGPQSGEPTADALANRSAPLPEPSPEPDAAESATPLEPRPDAAASAAPVEPPSDATANASPVAPQAEPVAPQADATASAAPVEPQQDAASSAAPVEPPIEVTPIDPRPTPAVARVGPAPPPAAAEDGITIAAVPSDSNASAAPATAIAAPEASAASALDAAMQELQAHAANVAEVRLLVHRPARGEKLALDGPLRRAGFKVEDRPNDAYALSKPLVKYFDAADVHMAELLAAALDGEALDLSGFRPAPSDRRIEIYLAE